MINKTWLQLSKTLHYSGEQKHETIKFIRLNYMKLMIFKSFYLMVFSMIPFGIVNQKEMTIAMEIKATYKERRGKKQFKGLNKSTWQRWNLNGVFKNLKELDLECL